MAPKILNIRKFYLFDNFLDWMSNQKLVTEHLFEICILFTAFFVKVEIQENLILYGNG